MARDRRIAPHPVPDAADPDALRGSIAGQAVRRPTPLAVRLILRLGLVAGPVAVAVFLIADGRRAGRALLTAEAVPAGQPAERAGQLRTVVRRHPLSPAAQRARTELRRLRRLPANLPPLSRFRVNYAAALPAALATLLAGIALLTNWKARRVPRIMSLAAFALSGATLLGQFDAVRDSLTFLAGPAEGIDEIGAAIPLAWGLAAVGLCLVYLEKRRQLQGRLAPWQVEKVLPERRSWALLSLGILCTTYALLALMGPVPVRRWEVHVAVLSPLLAGVLLGGKRGMLAQLAAGLVVVVHRGRFAGSLASAEAALQDPHLAFLVGFVVVPAVVAATLTERRRYHAGWVFLGLLHGVIALYVIALGALLIGHAVLPANGSAASALTAFTRAAATRLVGDGGLLVLTLGAVYLIGLPTLTRRRGKERAEKLQRLELEYPACELLALRGIYDLIVREQARFQQRITGREDNPLVGRLTGELDRLTQATVSRISRLERRVAEGERAQQEQLRTFTGETRTLAAEHEAAGLDYPSAAAERRQRLTEQLTTVRRARRDLQLCLAKRARSVEDFGRLATPAYLRQRCDETLAGARIFHTVMPADTDRTRPDVKAALDQVGQYFAASTGGSGGSGGSGGEDAGSTDQRRDLALRLKRRMETDYKRRAEEVAALARQADNLTRDLKALRSLWQRGAVSTALWTGQQQVFAQLLQTTHRQIDLRRRLLSIYRRAEPPLDLA